MVITFNFNKYNLLYERLFIINLIHYMNSYSNYTFITVFERVFLALLPCSKFSLLQMSCPTYVFVMETKLLLQ